MLMEEALSIINESNEVVGDKIGYMVSFEKREGGVLHSDHFPDKHEGEELIKTETCH